MSKKWYRVELVLFCAVATLAFWIIFLVSGCANNKKTPALLTSDQMPICLFQCTSEVRIDTTAPSGDKNNSGETSTK